MVHRISPRWMQPPPSHRIDTTQTTTTPDYYRLTPPTCRCTRRARRHARQLEHAQRHDRLLRFPFNHGDFEASPRFAPSTRAYLTRVARVTRAEEVAQSASDHTPHEEGRCRSEAARYDFFTANL
jgi:hypothetical protein